MNRKQRVNISSQILHEVNSSSLETVTSGVHQGSILEPVLFIIDVNDLPHALHHDARPVIYANDTGILLTARSTKELKTKINSMLHYMIDWFSLNGLVLNIEKTNIAKFTPNLSKLHTKIRHYL
jgi:hypothetical protein